MKTGSAPIRNPLDGVTKGIQPHRYIASINLAYLENSLLKQKSYTENIKQIGTTDNRRLFSVSASFMKSFHLLSLSDTSNKNKQLSEKMTREPKKIYNRSKVNFEH